MDKIRQSELVQYAVEEINTLIACGFLDRSLEWQRTWGEFGLRLSEGSSGYVTIPESEIDRLATEARTSRIALDLVRYIQKSRMEAGAAIPSKLSEVVADGKAGRLSLDKPKRGRPPETARDFMIIRVGTWLELALENKRTRNRDLRGKKKRLPSISEILEDALPQTRIGYVDRPQIERVLGKRERPRNQEMRSLFMRSRFDDEDELVRV